MERGADRERLAQETELDDDVAGLAGEGADVDADRFELLADFALHASLPSFAADQTCGPRLTCPASVPRGEAFD